MAELSHAGQVQRDLFVDPGQQEKDRKLMTVLDSLNRQFGTGTIRCAAEGLQQSWQTQAKQRSPRYTTRWDELLRVL